MQVYTKILIGMFVGVAIGLTLGPKSALLEHDLYKIGDIASAPLFLAKGDPSSALRVDGEGPSVSIDLHVIETIRGALESDATWVQGRFAFSGQLKLRDAEGTLAAQLKLDNTDSDAVAWLRVDQEQLATGAFRPLYVPVSALGDTVISCLEPIGDVFMRLIKMVIVPLVFSSLLVGIAGLGDVRKLGRLGGRTLGLYVATTALAVTIGLTCATLIQPGSFIGEAERAQLQAQFKDDASKKANKAAQAPSAVDNLLEIIPDNPIAALTASKGEDEEGHRHGHQGNMLQIIFFAVIFGVALTLMGPGEADILVTFFDKVQQAMVMIIHIVMKLAPYGVAALLAEVIGNSGWSVLKGLFAYGLTVLLGLLLHATLVYGGLVWFWGKVSIGPFLRSIRPAQLLAFSTSSSSATLPVSMECAESSLGVSNSVSSFVLPLGSTVNMDGTALYQGVAALFIAQAFQVDLTMGDQLAIVLSATMASVGAAGVPGAGMITLAMVLTAVGIPAVGVALILGMDRLLDMFRTAVNVTGDLAVTIVMAVSEGETINPLSGGEDESDPERGFEGRLDRESHPVSPDGPDDDPVTDQGDSTT